MLELRDSYQGLVDSAPQPPAREWLERRSRELRRRRHVLQAAAVAAIVTCLGAVAGVAWPRQAAPQRVRAVHQPMAVETTTTVRVAAPTNSPAVLPQTPAPGQLEPAARSGPAGANAVAPSPDNTPTHPGYPLASACAVDTTGLAPGGARSCRFTATKAGGWSASYYPPPAGSTPYGGYDIYRDPSAWLQVTHDGVTKDYGTDSYGNGCANAIILAGDLVEVDVYAPPPNTNAVPPPRYQAGAGNGWSCVGRPH
jgi:hypothetical protein